MWSLWLALACQGKGPEDACVGAECEEPGDDACAEVEGAKFSDKEFGDWRLGDVAFRSCRALSPGLVPVLPGATEARESGSTLFGSLVSVDGGDGSSELIGMVGSVLLEVAGPKVRPLESEHSDWAQFGEIGIWAATTGDQVDVDGNGVEDLIIAAGGFG